MLLGLLAAVAGCGGKPAEDCGAIATRLLPILSGGQETVGVEVMKNVVDRCQTRSKGSADDVLFRCVAAAKDDAGIMTCVKDATSVLESARDTGTKRPSRRAGEAELQMAKLKTNAKAIYTTDASYPVVTAPLTPSTPCCEQPGGRCQPNAADWATPAWQALDFQLDEPHDFQYSYQGSNSTYVAVAIGDPGCSGKPIKLTLSGTAVGGNPSSSLERQE